MAKEPESSLTEQFSGLADPRILLKTSHRLIDIVVITVFAMLGGADDWVEIANFARGKEALFRRFLELPNGIPSHDTFGRVYARVEPSEFGKCLIRWLREVFPSADTDIIAIDGKPPTERLIKGDSEGEHRSRGTLQELPAS